MTGTHGARTRDGAAAADTSERYTTSTGRTPVSDRAAWLAAPPSRAPRTKRRLGSQQFEM
jgi:hypothetical protein